MAKRIYLTDEAVEREIEELRSSEFVQLAKAEERLKYRRRQYLYNLRQLEKRGRELSEKGYDMYSLAEEYCTGGDE